MTLKRPIQPGTCVKFESPEAFTDLKQNFKQAVKDVDYNTLNLAIDALFYCLQDIANRKELDILKSLLTFNKGKEDKADKIQCYLATNYNFPSYQFKWHIKPGLFEVITSHLNEYDAFEMIQVLDAYSTMQRRLTNESWNYINEGLKLQRYIDNNKYKSVSQIQKETGKDRKTIEDLKNGIYTFTERSEIKKIVRAKLYLLTGNHKRFTFDKKDKTDPRTYTAFTILSKVYRNNEFCFKLQEFDIKSANPQIIDRLFGFNRFQDVYSNLMQAYNIDRDKAKVKFNATLNNHRLSRSQAENVYFKAGYSASEARQISKITAGVKKGSFYRYMAGIETEIINEFIANNLSRKKYATIHDGIYFYKEFINIDNPEFNGIDYSRETIPFANIPLELQQERDKPVLTAKDVTSGNFRQYLYPNGQPILKYENGTFFFYDRTFKVLNANFNINASVIDKGHKRSPTDADFLQRIDRLYISLLYLNENEGLTRRIFENCIDAILAQDGISFNKHYVMTYIQRNEYDAIDAGQYFKERDYNYQGRPLKESVFQHLLHKARGEMLKLQDYKILRRELRKLITAFENNNKLRFIDKAMFNRSRSTNTHAIITKIHKQIGIKRKDKLNNYNSLVNKFTHHKKTDSILGCDNNFTSLVNSASENEISKEYNVSRPFAKQFKSILKDKETIIQKLENAIANLQELTEVEDLFKEPAKQKPIKQPEPIRPENYEYNTSILKYYLHKWNQESEMIKTSYKSYSHPFLVYVNDNYQRKRSAV